MFNFIKSFILFSIILLMTANYNSVLAQIVNIESKRNNKIDSSDWNGSVNMGFNFVENGKRIITIKGNFRLEHLRGPHLFLSISDMIFGKIDNDGFQNKGFQHFRYNYSIKTRLTWEAFAQWQYNERIKLNTRILAGTGPRFAILYKDPYNVYTGIAYMYEYNEEEYGDPISRYFSNDHRLSTYISFSLKPSKLVRILSTSYFQPVLNNFDDLRLSSVSSLELNITKQLKFINTFNVSHDSRVPEGVSNTIYSYLSGLKFTF